MGALRETTQIIDLFSTIAALARIETTEQNDSSETFGVIKALAEIGVVITKNVAGQIDPFSGVQQPAPTEADTHAGYEAARAWFTDLDARVRTADGYYVTSDLPQAFKTLPPPQHEGFLAAVGSLVGGHLTDGDSIYDPEGFNFAESIALDAMTPEQQDAWADKKEQEWRAGNA